MEDSFDNIFATLEVPSEPKQPRLDENPPNVDCKVSTEPTLSKPSTTCKSHCVLVSSKQRGNPLLNSITNVPWEYDDIVPDYIMGLTTCALFLSLRYHNLNPDYIHERLKKLGKMYELRVLLVQIDLKEPHNVLKHLTRLCILADMTLMLAWSAEEAGRIIETYKMFETKPPDLIMERAEQYPHQKLVSALTNIKPINKTDAMTLLSSFGSLERIVNAPEHKLAACAGFGQRKAIKLYKTLHEPFLKVNINSRGNATATGRNDSFEHLLTDDVDFDDVLDTVAENKN